MNLLRILIIFLLITPLEKKETVINMNKDWYRIRDVYDYDPKTKSWEPTGIKLDMDEYEECPNCFVMLAKRYNSFVIRNEKGEMITCYKCFNCRVKFTKIDCQEQKKCLSCGRIFLDPQPSTDEKSAVRVTNKIYPFGPVLYNH